jgi:hypothetical protein
MSYKLPRAAAEELGIPSAAIIALIDAWEKKGGIPSLPELKKKIMSKKAGK